MEIQSNHLKFKEKLEEMGFYDPTFYDLYVYFKEKGIHGTVEKIKTIWFYSIHYSPTEYYFNEIGFDNPDFCELAMFKFMVMNMEDITDPDYDWALTLTEEQKAQIERGMEDVKNGRVVPHEEVMERIKNLLKK